MNAIRSIKQNGWMYSIAILFNRLVPEWLFRTRRFVVYQIDPNKVVANPSDDSAIEPLITIHRCSTEAEIRAVEKLTYFQRSYTTGNATAYSIHLEDQLVAGMWAATHCFDENELGIRIRLNQNQTWLFAASVPKEFRRQGLYSKLLSFTINDLTKLGYDDLLVAVNPDNVGSNGIHQKLSKQTVGHVLAIRFWKTTCCWTWGDIRKDSTISWNSPSQPIGIRREPAQVTGRTAQRNRQGNPAGLFRSKQDA